MNKTRPPPRRTVGRLHISEEKDVGRRAQTQQLTVLEERSISIEVLNQYKSYLTKFENFCRAEGLQWPLVANCDEVLADYLDIMFLDSRSANEGEKTVAAMEFSFPGLRGRLTRSRRALKGWRKEQPPKSRLPMPAIVMAGMAMDMLARGKRLHALRMVVDYDTYLRPGESAGLRGKDVVTPVHKAGRMYHKYMLIVRDQEEGVPDKVGIFDNSISLDTPSRSYLGPLLEKHINSMKNKCDPLYPFTNQEFRKEFAMSCKKIGLEGLHPYLMRHGGASEDLGMGIRDHAAVKSRGRWFTDQSVRRYAKIGKIQRMISRLSPPALEYCQWSLANLERAFKGLVPAKAA
jgi:integrase